MVSGTSAGSRKRTEVSRAPRREPAAVAPGAIIAVEAVATARDLRSGGGEGDDGARVPPQRDGVADAQPVMRRRGRLLDEEFLRPHGDAVLDQRAHIGAPHDPAGRLVTGRAGAF